MLANLVPLILYAWVLVVIFLFSRFPPTKAVLIAFIAGTLFLPQISVPGPAGLEIGKIQMTALGCLLATIIFETDRLISFVPGLLDLPFVVFSLWVLPSQLTNGLSPFSPVANHILHWSIPYLMGRIYFNNLSALRELTIAIFIGGLAYAPFCLWESRMSPQLHVQIYGPIPGRDDFSQSMRLGGYRPSVFLGHGLPVGMWMAAAAVSGVWLWQFQAVKKLFNQPIYLLAIGQIITFALVRSTGAYVYAVASLGILLVARWFRTSLPLFLLVFWIAGTLVISATGRYYEIPKVKQAIYLSYNPELDTKKVLNDRSGSYWFRIRNEKVLSAHARKRLFAGWGGSGGNFTIDPNTGRRCITDSLWILAYGVYGVPGLVSFVLIFLLPAIPFLIRYPARMWKYPQVAPVSVLPVILVIYMWDSTLNAFPNAVFLVISGGLTGMLSEPPERLLFPSPALPAAKNQGGATTRV